MIIFSSHGCYKSTVIFYHNKYGAETGQSGATNIVKLPLAFVRGGALNVSDGKIWSLGQRGHYWSRTPSTPTGGRFLWVLPADVLPSHSNSRRDGSSLRCLYPGN